MKLRPLAGRCYAGARTFRRKFRPPFNGVIRAGLQAPVLLSIPTIRSPAEGCGASDGVSQLPSRMTTPLRHNIKCPQRKTIHYIVYWSTRDKFFV